MLKTKKTCVESNDVISLYVIIFNTGHGAGFFLPNFMFFNVNAGLNFFLKHEKVMQGESFFEKRLFC